MTKDVFAMDTVMTMTVYGDASFTDAAGKEIERLEGLLSAQDPSSELYTLNASGEGAVSADTAAVIARGLSLYEETDGAFDIAIYPLMKSYGFPTKDYRVPSDEEIASLLPLCDANAVALSPLSEEPNDGASATGDATPTNDATASDDGISATNDTTPTNNASVTRVSLLEPGMSIDLGGIAKGYTGTCLRNLCREHGIDHALFNLGGNVEAVGGKPDGSPWNVAIRDPEDPSGTIGVLSVTDASIVTSGGYERFFEEDGITYHHILDPSTGRPAKSDLLSVTVICDDGMTADGLSTALFVMGKEQALAFRRAHLTSSEHTSASAITYAQNGTSESAIAYAQNGTSAPDHTRTTLFELILVKQDGSITITSGIADRFTSSKDFTIVE